MTNDSKDQIYAQPHQDLEAFCFDRRVVDVFPDMIKRSVPGYATILHMIGQIAGRYAQSNSRCYDLGCSLGAATLAMRHQIHHSQVKIVAIDNSEDMVKRCQQVVDADAYDVPVQVLCQDILETDIQNASVCVLNFTLQFLKTPHREILLKKIYEGMNSQGILILSEKLRFDDDQHDNLMLDLHHDFKKANGYSDLEIAQKRSALEDVLIPETFDTHKTRLTNIGFKNTDLWFQCFNFASMIAFKA